MMEGMGQWLHGANVAGMLKTIRKGRSDDDDDEDDDCIYTDDRTRTAVEM